MPVRVIHKNPNALNKIFKQYKENYEIAIGYPMGTDAVSAMYPVRNNDPNKVIDYSLLRKHSVPSHDRGVSDKVGVRSSGGNNAPMSVLEVAAMNEFGTSTIPARPFMKLSKPKAEKMVRGLMKPMIKKLNRFSITKKGIANVLAQLLPPVFKKTITGLKDPPNAPLTIAMKKSSNPLVDTNLMTTTLTGIARKSTKR